jgi:murein DD-endopeptidase MepM/ murein hydrolase activator NlpD
MSQVDERPDDRNGTVTILVVPDGREGTREWRISYRRIRWYRRGAWALGFILILMTGSWFFLAARAREAGELEARVGELIGREDQVAELARALDEVEDAYNRLRALFGADGPAGGGELWLPPPAGRPMVSGTASGAGASLPTGWPLTERGFVTQMLMDDAGIEHPGIDIAIPHGSYIRAAGAGTIIESGADAVYGHYLVLDHGEGYRSLYAHASLLLAEAGDEVRRFEVIALSGSSGRSTAPHLHFEILLDSEPVDPLTMVAQP